MKTYIYSYTKFNNLFSENFNSSSENLNHLQKAWAITCFAMFGLVLKKVEKIGAFQYLTGACSAYGLRILSPFI